MTLLEFYRQLAQTLAHEAVVLATVARVKGSVPREVGAKMWVRADGRIVGTIGGGAGEAKVQAQALEVLRSGEKQWVEVDLCAAPNRVTQGVCGGLMQVWLERWAGSAALALARQIQTRLAAGGSGTLVTPFGADLNPYWLDALDRSPETAIRVYAEALVEPLFAPPTLLIVGAGHVAVALAQVAKLAGFQIVVVDERPEFACRERFPDQTTILAQPIASALATWPWPASLYVALVTRSYQHDLAALRLVLPRPTQYIGMIGSATRVHKVCQILLQENPMADFGSRLYAPIGLAIGALTPEEIAVSIGAELIKVRRGGTETSLSESSRQADGPELLPPC